MSITINYRREILNLSKELLEDELRELIDFAQFLKAKKERFTYMQVGDSAEYVRYLRAKEAKKVKSSKDFIKELIEWQKSNS